MAAARAALEQATWKLDQKRCRATRAGRVFDTLYREGEWVAAGSPVVRLLPPQNVKVRFFVPRSASSAGCKAGRAVAIQLRRLRRRRPGDAQLRRRAGRVHAAGDLQQREPRSKLVFLVEARPAADERRAAAPGPAGRASTLQ